MKLYTQDQVLNMLEVCRDSDLYEHILTFEDILKIETSIEVPSDEEIEKFANEYVKNKWEYAQDENKESFVEGAKSMRDKIGGNNEQ